MLIRCAFIALGSMLLGGMPALAFQPPGGQGEFVPVTDLPAAEQLPAAPLLVGAYAFVWLALMLYLWSIWRRLARIDAEIQTLGRRTSHGSGSR
jgi:CcmD family protein